MNKAVPEFLSLWTSVSAYLSACILSVLWINIEAFLFKSFYILCKFKMSVVIALHSFSVAKTFFLLLCLSLCATFSISIKLSSRSFFVYLFFLLVMCHVSVKFAKPSLLVVCSYYFLPKVLLSLSDYHHQFLYSFFLFRTSLFVACSVHGILYVGW